MFDNLQVRVLAAAHATILHHWDYRGPNRDPYARLYLITGGRGAVDYGGSRSLVPGSLYLIPSRVAFRFGSARGMSHYYMHFTAHLSPGVSLFDVLDLPFERTADARALQLASEAAAGSWGTEVASASFSLANRVRLLLEPFVSAARRREDRAEAQGRVERMAPAIRYIDENLHRGFSVADVAATVHLHPTYFANRFAALLGMPPRTFVRRRRIEAAQVMLVHSGLSVSAIAESVGFADPAYFNRVFRSIVGTSPGDYRRRSSLFDRAVP